MQGLLGMRVEKGALRFQFSLPKGWPGWFACWKKGEGILHITVCRGEKNCFLLDGKPVDSIPLTQLKGEHQAEITVSEEK